MPVKNPRGPMYGMIGAAAAIAVCLSAMVLAPAPVSHPDRGATTLARAAAPAASTARGQHRLGMGFLAREEAQGGDCVLTVPANPLSAAGLATPYQLSNGPNTTGCTMANAANLGAFVQATILDPATGRLSVYDPLVVTAGTQPAAAPPVPVLPAGAVVTIDTGFNGNILFLRGPGSRIFVQGLPGSPFGQVSFANGPAFFAAAHAVAVPALGTAKDGMPCPTTRDFSLVDQDQSDNVTTIYLVNPATGQTSLPGSAATGTSVSNGSDNRLLTHFVDPALGCAPFMVPSLSTPGTMEATQAADELMAAADQRAPVALVPPNDPMTTVGADPDIIAGDLPKAGNLSAVKTDLYRSGAGQPLTGLNTVATATMYCNDLKNAGARVALDAKFEPGPSPTAGETLAQFMAARYANSLVLLNCKLFK